MTERATAGVRVRQSPARLGLARWLPIGLIAGLTLAFFARQILFGHVFIPADLVATWYPWKAYFEGVVPQNRLLSDVIALYYPQDVFIASQLRQRALPLWDPTVLGGHPLLANGLSAVLYPTRLLFLSIMPVELAHDLNLLLHLFLAGLFSYQFLRQIGLRRFGALVGAIAWMFNGFVMVWFSYGHTAATAALLPLALLLLDRATFRKSVVWAILLAAVVALSLASGNIQRSLYLLMGLSAYALLRVVLDVVHSRTPKAAIRPAVYYILGVAGGFALAAGTILPTLEVIEQSQRGAMSLADLFPQQWLRIGLLATFIAPGIAGGPTYSIDLYRLAATNANEFQGYAGLLPLILAVVAVVSRRAHAVFFGLLALATLLLALGTPLYSILYHTVPGFKQLSPTRLLLLYSFAVAMLSGLGADYLVSPASDVVARRLRRVLLVLVPTAALGLVAVNIAVRLGRDAILARGMDYVRTQVYGTPLNPRSLEEYYREIEVLYEQLVAHVGPTSPAIMVPVTLGIGCLAVLFLRERRPNLFPIACVALVTLDLFYFGWTYNPAVSTDYLYPQTEGIRFLLSDKSAYRVAIDATDGTMFPNTLQAFGIQEVGGYQSLYSQRYAELLGVAETGKAGNAFANMALLTRFDSNVLDLLNVKYVVRPPGKPAPAPGFRAVYNGDMSIYENLEALPRAFYAANCVVVADGRAALEAMQSEVFEPRRTVILETDTSRDQACGTSAGTGSAALLEYSAHKVIVGTSAYAGGWLVLADTFDPGWRASVDGVPTKVHRADYALRGVRLPPGDHTVTFTYEPSSYNQGLVISGAAAALGLLSLAFVARRRLRDKESAYAPPAVGED